MLLTENEAISSVLDGNKEAFSVIVSLYEQTVFSIALRMTRDREAAMDLSQEAFIQAYKKLPLFKRGKPFGPWIYRITHNLCLNHIKRRKNRAAPVTGVSDILEESPSKETQPLHEIEKRDTAKFLKELDKEVDNLPPMERSAFLLRYTDNLCLKDMSSILSVPVNTIKTHLFRGREKLRSKLSWWFQ